MLRFYWGLIRGAPKALRNAADLTLSIATVVVFFGALFNRRLGEKLVTAWHGISPWWSLVPVGLLFAYALMKSNYEQYCQLQNSFNKKLAEKDLECSRLREQHSKLLLEVQDLRKPKRSESEERTFQGVKAIIDKRDGDETLLLRSLNRHGKMIHHHSGGVSSLPHGLTTERAVAAANRLRDLDLITIEPNRTIQSGWENAWKLSAWAELVVKELL